MVGSHFILSNISDLDIKMSKQFFLDFSGYSILESTKYGDIIGGRENRGNIYINGMLIAHEDNFFFGYITVLNAMIRKSLNRERTNVGRTAYTTTIKQIYYYKTIWTKLTKSICWSVFT